MHRLGGHVLGFSDAKMTRAGDFYQESIKDTVHMLEYYGDVIAMRHFQQGAPAEAARWASRPGHQLRRRLGRAPDAGADRPVHDVEGDGPARRADLPARRRHAHADDALDPVRALAVRREGVRRRRRRRCRSCPSSRSSSTSGTSGYEVAESVEDVHRRGGRDLHGAGRPGRLHEVARRARRRRASRRRRRRTGSRASCCGRRRRPARSSCTPCRGWTSSPRTSTPRATRATGARRSTAS